MSNPYAQNPQGNPQQQPQRNNNQPLQGNFQQPQRNPQQQPQRNPQQQPQRNPQQQPQRNPQQQPQRNPQNNGQQDKKFDFNRISELPSKYPRQQIPENNEANMELGDCCGTLRTCIPCICCVQYPYEQIDQSYVGIFQRFGKYAKTTGPGLQYFNPFTDSIHVVDMKANIINLQRKKTLTKDNIEVDIDGTVYFHIKVPRKTYYAVEDITKSVRQLTFATLRSICGQYIFQDILEKREEIQLELGKFVSRQVHQWGIQITNIFIKDITLDAELQEQLSAVAKQERLAQSKILNAKAQVEAAKLLRQSADMLSSKAAMQIRYLETIKGIASNQHVNVVFLAEQN